MGTFLLKTGRQILKFVTLSMKLKKGELMRRKNHFHSLRFLCFNLSLQATVMFQKLATRENINNV